MASPSPCSWKSKLTASILTGALMASSYAASFSTLMQSPGNATVSICGSDALARASAVIVIADSPAPAQRHAAEDLADHLYVITGQRLEIIADSQTDPRFPIIVGNAPAALKRAEIAIDFSALGAEGLRIKASGKALALAGNGQRGIHYAVYAFLEDYLNCRWFTEDCVAIPLQGVFAIPELDITYIPPLEYRALDYPNSRPLPFAVRNRLNGFQIQDAPEWGGNISYQGFVHTFDLLVPPAIYGKEHPEYYSEINGVRMTQNTQLCLTNPEVLRIAKANVRKWLAENPRASIVSVSQNDNVSYCTCPKCQELAEREGSQSGPLLHFVNAIARDIAKDYPDKIIDTLAYRHTRKPPKFVKPEPNVAVRLCSIECCFAHPLATCPDNASFVQDIRDWNAICKRLHIWDYVINYAHCLMPFPNLRVLQPNIQFFIENGVTGIYEEGNYFTKGGELAELRTYILAKCLWKPDTDVKKAITEFTDAYYGPAAPFIREYLTLLHDSVCSRKDLKMTIYDSPEFLADPAFLNKALELLTAAQKAVANDDTLLHRVKLATVPIIYTKFTLSNSVFKRTPTILLPTVKASPELYQIITETARREGITKVREGGSADMQSWLEIMRPGDKPLEICVLENDALRLEIIPDRGARIWSAILKKSSREILHVESDGKGGFSPSSSGIELFASHEFGNGCNHTFTVTARTAMSITMECTMPGQKVLTRVITLDPAAPRFTIDNTAKTLVPCDDLCFRTHPLFDFADAVNTHLDFTDVAGNKHRQPLAILEGESSQACSMSNDALPNGSWEYVNDATGIAVVNTFRSSDVSICYAYWSQQSRLITMELFGKKHKAAPGDSISMSCTYEIRQTKQ